MDEDRIDFSALDPHRSPQRREHQVQQVLAAIHAPSSTTAPLQDALLRRGPVFAGVALALLVAAWAPVLVRGDGGSVKTVDTYEQVSGWAQADAVPAEADLEALMGASHAY